MRTTNHTSSFNSRGILWKWMDTTQEESGRGAVLGTVMGRSPETPAVLVTVYHFWRWMSHRILAGFSFLIYKSRTLEYMTLSPCQFKILRFLRQPLPYLKRLHDTKSDSQGCALVVRKILLRHSPTQWDGSGEKQERHVLCDMRVASEKKGHSLFH